MTKTKLEKGLYVCLIPSEKKIDFQCVGRSKKEKTGTSLSITQFYSLYLINNCNFEIEIERKDPLSGEGRLDKISPKSKYLIREIQYWEFDWTQDYIYILKAFEKSFHLSFEISRSISKDFLKFVPILEQEAYNYFFTINPCDV